MREVHCWPGEQHGVFADAAALARLGRRKGVVQDAGTPRSRSTHRSAPRAVFGRDSPRTLRSAIHPSRRRNEVALPVQAHQALRAHIRGVLRFHRSENAVADRLSRTARLGQTRVARSAGRPRPVQGRTSSLNSGFVGPNRTTPGRCARCARVDSRYGHVVARDAQRASAAADTQPSRQCSRPERGTLVASSRSLGCFLSRHSGHVVRRDERLNIAGRDGTARIS